MAVLIGHGRKQSLEKISEHEWGNRKVFFFFASKLVTEIYYDLLKSVLHTSHMSHKRENSEELFEDQGHVP